MDMVFVEYVNRCIAGISSKSDLGFLEDRENPLSY